MKIPMIRFDIFIYWIFIVFLLTCLTFQRISIAKIRNEITFIKQELLPKLSIDKQIEQYEKQKTEQ